MIINFCAVHIELAAFFRRSTPACRMAAVLVISGLMLPSVILADSGERREVLDAESRNKVEDAEPRREVLDAESRREVQDAEERTEVLNAEPRKEVQ